MKRDLSATFPALVGAGILQAGPRPPGRRSSRVLQGRRGPGPCFADPGQLGLTQQPTKRQSDTSRGQKAPASKTGGARASIPGRQDGLQSGSGSFPVSAAQRVPSTGAQRPPARPHRALGPALDIDGEAIGGWHRTGRGIGSLALGRCARPPEAGRAPGGRGILPLPQPGSAHRQALHGIGPSNPFPKKQEACRSGALRLPESALGAGGQGGGKFTLPGAGPEKLFPFCGAKGGP